MCIVLDAAKRHDYGMTDGTPMVVSA